MVAARWDGSVGNYRLIRLPFLCYNPVAPLFPTGHRLANLMSYSAPTRYTRAEYETSAR